MDTPQTISTTTNINNNYNKPNKTHNKSFSLSIMDDYQPNSRSALNTTPPPTSSVTTSTTTSPTKSSFNNTSKLGSSALSSSFSHYSGSNIDSVEATFNKRNSINEDEAKDILNSHIEIREKEIERQIRFAEKDKKDSLLYSNLIKECKEVLQGYIKDFYEDNEDQQSRKNTLIERSSMLTAIESVSPISSFISVSNGDNSISSPSTISATSNHDSLVNSSSGSLGSISLAPQNSLSFWEQQNINNSNGGQQHKNDEKSNSSVSLLVSSYHNKDEELERVRVRASTESIRANYLRDKYDELSKLVQQEKEHWSRIVIRKRKEVECKEREINRLLMVAESQKKKSMDVTDQITKLKKSLSSISAIRANQSTLDIKKINEKCSFESLSPSPNLYNSLANSSNKSPIYSQLGVSSGNVKSLSSSNSLKNSTNNTKQTNTEEKKEILMLDYLIDKKDDELKRIKEIMEFENSKTQILTNKVTELKSILEEESRQVEVLQNQTIKEIREKEEAIIRVALRAHKERIKSNQINDQIKKLTKVIQNPNQVQNNNNNENNQNSNKSPEKKSKNNSKSPELEPIGINFMEMGELKQFQDLSLNPYCDENILNNCCLGKLPITSLLSASLQSNSSSFLNQYQPQNYLNNNNNNNNFVTPNFININSSNNSINLISSSPTISYNSPKPTNVHSNNQNNNPNLNSPSLIVRNQLNNVTSSSSSINIPSNGRVKLYPTGESPSNNGSTSIFNSQILSKSPKSSNYSTSPSNHHFNIQNQTIVGSPSEVIMFKLKEIERLTKETIHKEQELSQVKKIAEAERSRLCLLKDKFKELRSEILDRDTLYYEKYATKTY